MGPLYRLADVRHQYGLRTVLNIPCLEIAQGEVFALIGPSGSGKSTLLRLLALLETPTEGVLEYRGMRSVPGIPLDERRGITMMFQQPLLLSSSVRENVEYGLAIRSVDDRRAAMEALAEVGLTDLAGADSRTLSGGERQRVALARAIAFQPNVLLLDEPTAHLDPANVRIIEGVVARQRQERNVTVVFATHNLHQARRLGARVGMLLDGEIIEIGPATKMLETPVDPRTRAFIEGGMPY